MGKVLVTGGAGFIGSHLVDRLVRDGHEVVVVDNLSSGRRAHLAASPSVRLLIGDVREIADFESELQGVEVVFHLAGLISGQDSLREPSNYMDVNVNGTLKVIDLLSQIGARRIVLASSSTIYGNAAEPERRETTLPEPLTTYALSKLTAEHMLAIYSPLKGFSHAALRLFNVYGPRQNPNHPYANVTCKVAHAASSSRAVDVFGDGDQTRDFVFVDDVVNAFVLVASESKQTLYNVGSGVSRSINEIIALVERASAVKLTRRDLPPWPNDIRSIRADISRLRADHGYAPQVNLETGLARTIAYFRDS